MRTLIETPCQASYTYNITHVGYTHASTGEVTKRNRGEGRVDWRQTSHRVDSKKLAGSQTVYANIPLSLKWSQSTTHHYS